LIALAREAGSAAKQQTKNSRVKRWLWYLVGKLEYPLLRKRGRHFGIDRIIRVKVGICFEDLWQHNKIGIVR